MGAGGVADVVQGDSEEFGTNEPKKDPLDVNDNNNADTPMEDRDTSSSRPSGAKRQKTGDIDVSGSQKTSSTSTSKSTSTSTSHVNRKTKSAAQSMPGSGSGSGSAGSADPNDLDQIARHKAEKYVALDQDEVAMSSANTEAEKRDARAERGADALDEAKTGGKASGEKNGGHADVEEMHGKADTKKNQEPRSGAGESGGKNAGKGANGHADGKTKMEGGNDLDKVQRHQAEKFGSVNLENE
ncbi:hypothetical protein IAQ61_008669 [Plenodomus lingam]|nr:hypothetical protein IAQ61_008669 [Plenodomus lingam]